ncbi:MAG: hypothetical protein A4E27_01632 [Methanobacterium sp. PtaU1.Bin242]|nr:MAG: hypothetical protein A4E27_01632 [Methanobacterium sp. PtaU1.Bin242]
MVNFRYIFQQTVKVSKKNKFIKNRFLVYKFKKISHIRLLIQFFVLLPFQGDILIHYPILSFGVWIK